MGGFIYLIGCIFLMGALTVNVIRFLDVKFEFLKIIYPKILDKYYSYLTFSNQFRMSVLPSSASFWFWFPVYYNASFLDLDWKVDVESFKLRFKKLSKNIVIYFFSFIVWLYGVSFIY